MTPTPEALPPLPEPSAWHAIWNDADTGAGWDQWHDASDPMPSEWEDAPDEVVPHFTADQMHAYARAALAAPQPLDESALAVEALAHRIAWRYKKSTDPAHSDTFTFNRATLMQFAEAIAVQPQAAQAVEPVAWRETIQGAIDELPYQHYLIPRLVALLDATTTAQPQAQPLTTAQVIDAFSALPHERQHVRNFEAGVRFAERHHKIGTEGGAR